MDVLVSMLLIYLDATLKFVESSPWMLHDSTFEKMGALMHENNGRLLGLFDGLTAFLTKIRLYNTRGITDSHELAMFLELYNANPWTRVTGILYICSNTLHAIQ